MTPELTTLALAGLLQAVQLTLFAIPANLELGPHFTTSPRDGAPPRPMSKVTARLHRAVNNHFEALILFTLAVVLRDLGVPPPLIVLITLEGVKGAAYKVHSNPFGDPEPVIERDVVFLPECIINEYGEVADYHRAVKPAFDALWNTAGYVSAQTFSADGVWVGQSQNR